ncbi:hypothetical protein AB5I41_10970 [Sphingomonas sp. MMS24-JH45]
MLRLGALRVRSVTPTTFCCVNWAAADHRDGDGHVLKPLFALAGGDDDVGGAGLQPPTIRRCCRSRGRAQRSRYRRRRRSGRRPELSRQQGWCLPA